MILTIIWAVVLLLLTFWAIGFFILHLGFFIWLALILAVCGAIYGLIANQRARRLGG